MIQISRRDFILLTIGSLSGFVGWHFLQSKIAANLFKKKNVTSNVRAMNFLATTLDNFVDVKSLGAKGDGVANDTQAIQKAIDLQADRGGGIVYIPSGTYHTGRIVCQDNVHLLGTGSNSTKLILVEQTPSGEHIRIEGVKNVNISEISFQVKEGISGENCIGITYNLSSGTVAQDLSVYNCNMIGYKWNPSRLGGRGITAHPGTINLVAHSNIINNCSTGIDLQALPSHPTRGIVYANNTIKNCSQNGLHCYQGSFPFDKTAMDCIVYNNLFSECGGEAGRGIINGDRAVGIKFVNNRIINKKTPVESVFRGTFSYSQISNNIIQVDDLVSVFDFEPYRGGGLVIAKKLQALNNKLYKKKINILVRSDYGSRLQDSHIELFVDSDDGLPEKLVETLSASSVKIIIKEIDDDDREDDQEDDR